MLSRRWIHCSFPVRNERSLAGVGLGVCIGLLLGICFSFESRTDVEQKFVQQYFPAENRNVTERDIWIRCVVLVQPGDPRPHKYVRSILDTYAKRCNRTIFFTKEEKLLPKFHDEADIYALNNFHELTSYSFFHLIMQLTYGYSQKDSTTRTPPPRTEWIIFLNEQNFLVPENLRLLVKKYDSTDPVMFGRLAHSKWLLTYLFPFLQTETFQLDAGVLVSRAALEQIATSDECQPHWFLPAHTGKGLYACASKLNIATIDPIDGEGYRLFMADNLRNLFSLSHFSASEKSFEDAVIKANCCSDKLISIGLVNHRDLRVLEYLVNHVRVFGR